MVQNGDVWIEYDENGIPTGRWVWSDTEEMWVFTATSFFTKLYTRLFVINLLITLLVIGVIILSAGLVFFLIFRHKKKKKEDFSENL